MSTGESLLFFYDSLVDRESSPAQSENHSQLQVTVCLHDTWVVSVVVAALVNSTDVLFRICWPVAGYASVTSPFEWKLRSVVWKFSPAMQRRPGLLAIFAKRSILTKANRRRRWKDISTPNSSPKWSSSTREQPQMPAVIIEPAEKNRTNT